MAAVTNARATLERSRIRGSKHENSPRRETAYRAEEAPQAPHKEEEATQQNDRKSSRRRNKHMGHSRNRRRGHGCEGRGGRGSDGGGRQRIKRPRPSAASDADDADTQQEPPQQEAIQRTQAHGGSGVAEDASSRRIRCRR